MIKAPSYRSSLCFDDILLIPKKSDIFSRHNVDLTMKLGRYDHPSAVLELEFPVIASPMDTVCEHEMANMLHSWGGLGIIHRYMTKEKTIREASKCLGRFGVSVSVKDCYDKEYIYSLIEIGAQVICLDTANGHNTMTVAAVDELNQFVPKNIHIMAGNVATREGYIALIDAGADSVRVGIGGGSACTTRIVTGHGVPTLGSIIECKSLPYKQDVNGVIADGGIRNSGDMIKCFAAGANAVMIGGMFAGYDESPVVLQNGKRVFRGMASKEAQVSWRGNVSVGEGAAMQIEDKGSIVSLLEDMKSGIKSGCSYSGVDKLSNLKDNSEYIEISYKASMESNAHGKGRL